MNWTDENIERLRAMWKQGLACSAIGRALGCTRNAVIGKVDRLNLPARVIPCRVIRFASKAKPLPKEPPKQGSVSLLALESGMCRYPIGDPKDAAFGFCGCSQKEGSPYCAEHSAIAFTGIPDRRVLMLERNTMREAA